jgi:hypothetical protein
MNNKRSELPKILTGAIWFLLAIKYVVSSVSIIKEYSELNSLSKYYKLDGGLQALYVLAILIIITEVIVSIVCGISILKENLRTYSNVLFFCSIGAVVFFFIALKLAGVSLKYLGGGYIFALIIIVFLQYSAPFILAIDLRAANQRGTFGKNAFLPVGMYVAGIVIRASVFGGNEETSSILEYIAWIGILLMSGLYLYFNDQDRIEAQRKEQLLAEARREAQAGGVSSRSMLEMASEKAETDRVIRSGGWKCKRCGNLNQGYLGVCACGLTRQDSERYEEEQKEKAISGYYERIGKANGNATQTDMGDLSSVTDNSLKTAEALKRFKELLDMGVVTQEEFDIKKKQLLTDQSNKKEEIKPVSVAAENLTDWKCKGCGAVNVASVKCCKYCGGIKQIVGFTAVSAEAYSTNPQYGGYDQSYASNPQYGGYDQSYASNPQYGGYDQSYASNPQSGGYDQSYASNPQYEGYDQYNNGNPSIGAGVVSGETRLLSDLEGYQNGVDNSYGNSVGQEQKFCIYCGTPITPGMVFCTCCGSMLN